MQGWTVVPTKTILNQDPVGKVQTDYYLHL